jgi:hypothetical protein
MFSVGQLQGLFGAGGSVEASLFGARTQAAPSGDPVAALRNAQKNEARDVARVAKQPIPARDVARFKAAVGEADTVDELLKDRDALKVMLTAFGLEDQINSPGLVRRALKSDLTDPKSVANQLANSDARWRTAAAAFQLHARGLTEIKKAVIQDLTAERYVKEVWYKSLDASTPGLSTVLAFRDRAKTGTDALKVLGDPLLRNVITTAYNIPREIARQSLDSQKKAINTALDVSKLQDQGFVDNIARRYLMVVNGQSSFGSGGITA